MTTVSDVHDCLNRFAPMEMKMDFDNVGHLVGNKDTIVTKILVALDITDDVITESNELETEVIVSHHPLFFSIKNVTDSDLIGKKIMRLVRSGQSAICMHTNLDAARGGVNDALARAAGIADRREAELLTMRDRLPSGEVYSFGRVGCLECPCSMQEYLERLKKSLKTNGLRYHDAGRDVYKVAVVGGSGGDDFQNAVRQDCDTFITADIKYNLFLDAKELGINLIDGDHFCTENLVTGVLFEKLSEAFPEIETIVSTVHSQTVKFY